MAKPLIQYQGSVLDAQPEHQMVWRQISPAANTPPATNLSGTYDPLLWKETLARMSLDELEMRELSLMIDLLKARQSKVDHPHLRIHLTFVRERIEELSACQIDA